MSVDLSHLNVIVTGGGRGIGRAIAEAMSAAGASVAVLARSEAEIDNVTSDIVRRGGKAIALRCDVANEAEVGTAVAEMERALGPVDVLVNNAAVFGPLGPIAETSPTDWWRAMEVNVYGPLLCCHAVLPGMIARKRGRIVNVVSGAIPVSYFSSYMTGKSALTRLSECLALEVRAHNIAVFPMGPGTVRTAMSERNVTSDEAKKWIPWYKGVFDQGLDVPVERPAALAVALASGKYDALTGLTVSPFDNLDLMLEKLQDIERDKLFTMRVRTFENSESAKRTAFREKAAKQS